MHEIGSLIRHSGGSFGPRGRWIASEPGIDIKCRQEEHQERDPQCASAHQPNPPGGGGVSAIAFHGRPVQTAMPGRSFKT